MLAQLSSDFISSAWSKSPCVIGVVQAMVAYAVLAERKISAWIQDRVGPNRTAPPFVKYDSGARAVSDRGWAFSNRWRTV